MRTLVDIPDIHIKILNQLSKKKKISRAEIIRQALTHYITSQSKTKELYTRSFGIWKEKKLDSVEYQRTLRQEWK